MKKIVFTFNQFDQDIFFSLAFIKQSFSKNIVVQKEHYQISDDLDFFKSDLSMVITDLKKLINDNGFTGAPIIVNLNSNALFVEQIDLPL